MIRLSSNTVNVAIANFTLSPRPFTAYSADKIETILRYYGLIDKSTLYIDFDVKTEELVFQANADKYISKWIKFKNVMGLLK